MNILKCLLFLSLISLSSCVKDFQLLPEKDIFEKLEKKSVQYKIPSLTSDSESMSKLNFFEYSTGANSKFDRLLIHNIDSNTLKLERKTDNGSVGSGLIYKINISEEKTLNSTNIIYTPEELTTFQNGLILPFKVPEFDVSDYLSKKGYIYYNFEINSEYPPSSIKANFARTKGVYNKTGFINLKNGKSEFSFKIDAYRNGSKIIIQAKLSNTIKKENIIRMDILAKEFKNYIYNILDQ